ncbi:MAG: AraC family transcriptional regulator [Bacteroidota bacterium]
MKPSFERLTDNADHSFAIKQVVREKRSDVTSAGVWHYHPGYEITLTTVSKGRRFVGYNIENYEADDLVLIGENVPHCWITDEHTEQTVINFQRDFLGHSFMERPELKEVDHLLQLSQRGIKFGTTTRKKAFSLIRKMEKSSGFERLMNLFNLLNLLAHAEDTALLTTYDEQPKNSYKTSSRIEKVYNYVLNHYRDPDLSQAQLATELNMTPSSLCKFVKNVTRKTFFDLVLEARVTHACRLLVKSDKYVSEISFLSGFKNLSNFNRVFKRIMNTTPVEYRKRYS